MIKDLHVYLPPDLHRELKREGKRMGIASLNPFIIMVLEMGLKALRGRP